MTLIWIFVLVLGAVVSADNEPIGAAPGCGDTSVIEKPKEKEYGRVTDVNLCEKRYLRYREQRFLASCKRHCPSKNTSYPLPNGKICLQFVEKGFLQERYDEPRHTCYMGLCRNGECWSPHRTRVPCTIPKDGHNPRE
uniref:Evasin n=1 Tax=Amblyomma cajennense TaxID=34607 RepID=A0A023FSZ7_AMBCJ